jgi:hypothetical protein
VIAAPIGVRSSRQTESGELMAARALTAMVLAFIAAQSASGVCNRADVLIDDGSANPPSWMAPRAGHKLRRKLLKTWRRFDRNR